MKSRFIQFFSPIDFFYKFNNIITILYYLSIIILFIITIYFIVWCVDIKLKKNFCHSIQAQFEYLLLICIFVLFSAITYLYYYFYIDDFTVHQYNERVKIFKNISSDYRIKYTVEDVPVEYYEKAICIIITPILAIYRRFILVQYTNWPIYIKGLTIMGNGILIRHFMPVVINNINMINIKDGVTIVVLLKMYNTIISIMFT